MEREQSATARVQKHRLRRRLRAMRASLDPQERATRSRSICARIVALPEWTEARVVALYSALPGEVDLSDLVLNAVGKTLLWPVVVGRGDPLEFRAAPPTTPGIFGNLEPASDARRVDASDVDLVVIPGLAFDMAGRRLGQGGGFYDRTLAHTDATRLAVCFREQVVHEVPTEALDLSVDLVVHEAGVVRRRLD